MGIKTIRQLDVQGKKVLLRTDYNVPLSNDARVEDNTRISETLPTLDYLLKRGASIIILSHLGRPKGAPNPKYSLRPVSRALEELIRKPVGFADDCVGPAAVAAAKNLQPGGIIMLENLRFHPEEEKNDESFARDLSSLGDIYVNDAFSASHRAHASIVGIPKFKPSAAGFLVEKEVDVLTQLLENPKRPYAALLGGAKISDKLPVVKKLLDRVDLLFLGGAMAFTFLKSQGTGVGNSLVEDDFIDKARSLLEDYREKIKLPLDCVAAPSREAASQASAVALSRDRDDMKNLTGFDIGPAACREYEKVLLEKKPQTIFWNGPMGVFEIPEFAKGTLAMAQLLRKCAGYGADVVVGGGDSVAAIKKLGAADKRIHLSTGGGASLEFLEGKTLPGIAVLQASCHPEGALATEGSKLRFFGLRPQNDKERP